MNLTILLQRDEADTETTADNFENHRIIMQVEEATRICQEII
jgi:hypothetical protein